MAMHPMSPKRIPTPTAFKLLAELEEFFARPAKERRDALKDYAAAADTRQAALEKIESDIEAATSNRAGAAMIKSEAEDAAQAVDAEAKAKGKRVVDAANEQAESINRTVAENVAAAEAKAEALANASQEREDAVKAREDACEAREANAFKEREAAVTAREDEATRREREAEDMHALGLSTKEGYEALLRQINALVPAK